MKKQASLSEIALKLGINKSKLAFYFEQGIIKPITKIGRMNIYDQAQVIKKVLKKLIYLLQERVWLVRELYQQRRFIR